MQFCNPTLKVRAIAYFVAEGETRTHEAPSGRGTTMALPVKSRFTVFAGDMGRLPRVGDSLRAAVPAGAQYPAVDAIMFEITAITWHVEPAARHEVTLHCKPPSAAVARP